MALDSQEGDVKPRTGFQATAVEVKRFGHQAKKLVRYRTKLIDERSFASVVGDREMVGRGHQDFSKKDEEEEFGV